MAHQYPTSSEERLSPKSPIETQPQRAETNAERRELLPTGSLQRSNPIAILRKFNSSNQKDLPVETSDDDDSVIDVEMDAIRLGNAISLPARLLRAPRLVSIPVSSDNIRHHNMLPPPMQLSVQDNNTESFKGTISYGSLRDSHLQGRFLDGPSSFRDARTAEIYQKFQHEQHSVRFHPATTTNLAASATLTPLSIGERLLQKHDNGQQQLRKNLPSTSTTAASITASASSIKTAPTSSLAAMMMEASGSETSKDHFYYRLDNEHSNNTSQRTTGLVQSYQPGTFYQDDYYDGSSDILSTSLTALELLQRGICKPQHHANAQVSDELPRDVLGNNALLARSYSDPTPYQNHNYHHSISQDQQMRPQNHNSPSLHPPSSVAQSDPVSLQLPPLLGATSGNHAYCHVQELLLPTRDDNSDLEGAFDMDLE
jgi:hypothetical protein